MSIASPKNNMYIKILKLKNYRNYDEIEINFNPNINIIYGNNAAGKTNLLESTPDNANPATKAVGPGITSIS